MKDKKKPLGIDYKIRQKRKGKEHIALVATTSIAIILISSFLINSMLNQPSTSQSVSSTGEPKAAIVDQLSLTCPNQGFIETATNTLKQDGYTVDYCPSEQVTVEFYRNLATKDYNIIILRVHSTAEALLGKETVSYPVIFFTSELYSKTKYVYEQLTDRLVLVSYVMSQPPFYFAIRPEFVTSSMKGKFQNTVIIMMGCEGLNNTKMAQAFIEKGAKAYISWNDSVLAPQTDQATTHLLQHFLIEKQTIKEAVTETNNEVGPDPSYDSLLGYYPPEAGNYTLKA